MDRHDFWTTVTLAIAILLAESPSLIAPPAGTTDNYGVFRWLLIIGPLAMIVLAWLDLLSAKRKEGRTVTVQGGER